MIKRNFTKLILIALLMGVVVSAGVLFWVKNKQTSSTPTEEKVGIGQPPTYKTESEGQKIEVPKDVPEESIKNYELVTENEQFKIRKLDDTYTITLYAIINRPEQYDYYKGQLRDYKQNALNYLKETNINPDKVNIIYEPEEAKDL